MVCLSIVRHGISDFILPVPIGRKGPIPLNPPLSTFSSCWTGGFIDERVSRSDEYVCPTIVADSREVNVLVDGREMWQDRLKVDPPSSHCPLRSHRRVNYNIGVSVIRIPGRCVPRIHKMTERLLRVQIVGVERSANFSELNRKLP